MDDMDDMDACTRLRDGGVQSPRPPCPSCPPRPSKPCPQYRLRAERPADRRGFSPIPEIAANAALTLIRVAISLLDRQLTRLAADFEREGGFTERLYRVRSKARKSKPE